jgi:hypothetical protein
VREDIIERVSTELQRIGVERILGFEALDKTLFDEPEYLEECHKDAERIIIAGLGPLAARWRTKARQEGTPPLVAQTLLTCAEELVGKEVTHE